MALTIEHDEADRLARELAKLTGESVTDAVLNSLRERLSRRRNAGPSPSRADELMRIAKRSAARPLLDPRSADAILGYDEHGLPH